MIIDAIETALTRIDTNYCKLSRIIYSSESEIDRYLAKEKYLERPFAYEFYHQFRTLIDDKIISFDDSILQAEVDKRYQHLSRLGKIPDFILHKPNSTKKNLAVIEFKLASNAEKKFEDDFEKLVCFKQVEKAAYECLVEVVIGDSMGLEQAWEKIERLGTGEGEEIVVIAYNVINRAIEKKVILFKPVLTNESRVERS